MFFCVINAKNPKMLILQAFFNAMANSWLKANFSIWLFFKMLNESPSWALTILLIIFQKFCANLELLLTRNIIRTGKISCIFSPAPCISNFWNAHYVNFFGSKTAGSCSATRGKWILLWNFAKCQLFSDGRLRSGHGSRLSAIMVSVGFAQLYPY